MHYNLTLTYFVYYLVIGSGLKNRIKLPFFQFHRWYPEKLFTNKLNFWLALKFLVFDSFENSINLKVNKNSYIGYFPLPYFFSIYNFSQGFSDRFSFISRVIIIIKINFLEKI